MTLIQDIFGSLCLLSAALTEKKYTFVKKLKNLKNSYKDIGRKSFRHSTSINKVLIQHFLFIHCTVSFFFFYCTVSRKEFNFTALSVPTVV